ncbi:MAG: hypothetical protein DRR16_15740 [Candidatus Parabeggiatoa sp. nov. 3]|jgi:hypothetical protein|nr:MAG: hypothetical protein DRR00_20985 [Gammaproteobacteria bacterium]RKZ61201.1 MAG: hypothetical protein DRQ99_20835 [Gammaproteobacteria bacterium]RKZ84071.1 MAG: hypothetical protein DRR16_15740 [Gammaproteobacteria bacterium]
MDKVNVEAFLTEIAMDIFFNELSLKKAADDDEARRQLENLADVAQLLKRITESLGEDAFAFRRSEDFAQQKITQSQSILAFLQTNYDFSDPVYIFLLGMFDSPYITEDDPQKNDYDLISITINETEYSVTGIAAAYLKYSLVVSLDSDAQWDVCRLDFSLNKLNEQAEIVTEQQSIKNASKKQHVIKCHLPFLTTLCDWADYKPRFKPDTKEETILHLKEIYSLSLSDDIEKVWETFYQALSQMDANQRVSKVLTTAAHIAKIQNWERATGSLENNNSNRTIYTIPNSNFIVSVDTQHGEFEIHRNQKGNNHLGALSFDGKSFKNRDNSRSLKL